MAIIASGYNFPSSITLSASMLRCLAAVLAECQERGRVTWRGIISRLGFKSQNSIKQPMDRLREMGLVTWEDRQGGTIRPTCYMRLYPAAFNGEES